jgi:hypothetical protein
MEDHLATTNEMTANHVLQQTAAGLFWLQSACLVAAVLSLRR